MKMQKLSELTSLLSGFAFNASLFNDEKMGLPLIRVRDVNSGFAGFYYSGSYDQQFVVTKGDILISLDGDFKAIEWKGDEALLNQRVCKIIPNEDLLNREYLLHFLPEILKDIHRKTRYTTVKHLSTKTINSIEIPVPSLPDQRHIAQLLSQAEQLIAQRQESLRLLDAYLKSTFLEMFGDPGTNPLGWSLVKLEETFLSKPLIGSMIPAVETGLIPIVRVGEIGNKLINFHKCKYSQLGEADIKKYHLLNGDILLARAIGSESHLGKASIYYDNDKTVVYDSHVMRLRFNSNIIHPEFFYTFLQTQGGRARFLRKAGQTSIQFNINSKQISDLEIPIPPLSLQTQFAQIVAQTEMLKTHYQQSLAELEQLYGSLSQRAFRGELKIRLFEENH